MFHSNTIHHTHFHLHICYHLPKNTLKSYKKALCQKVLKISHVGMHFHQKTLPQKPMKQATKHIVCIHRLPRHQSAMHLPCSYHPYIFPTIPTTIRTTPPYSTAYPILPSTHTTIHLLTQTLTINHITLSPSNSYPYILIHNHYILHKTQNPTL